MKKLTCLCIVATLMLLMGCGDRSDKVTDASPGKPAGKESTLEKIKREKVIHWGADPSGGAPFVFGDEKDNKKKIGFEVDMMDKIAEHMGVKHEIVTAQWDALPDDMDSRRSDFVLNGYEITDARKAKYDFSEPYYVYEQQLTIRAEDKEKYKSVDDLKGKKVGTLSGAEANNVLMRAGFSKDLLDKKDDSITPYDDLLNKRTDAVLQENIIAAYYAAPSRKPGLYNIPKTFAPGMYGVIFRQGDTGIRDEINKVLAEMKKNGELAAIYKKWNMWTDKQKEIGVVDK